MKFISFTLVALAVGALAQSLPPSPTNSVGCEPHGDHWHCDGPVETGVSAVETDEDHTHSDAHTESDDDHGHEHTTTPITTGITSPVAASQTPDTVSATASDECEPHGDHWHCPSGVAEPTTPPAESSASSAASAAVTSGSLTTTAAAGSVTGGSGSLSTPAGSTGGANVGAVVGVLAPVAAFVGFFI